MSKGTLIKTLNNAGWLTAGRLIGDVIALVLFTVISRIYGPTGIGVYSYAFAIAGIMYAFSNLGFEDFAIKKLSILSRNEGSLLFSDILGIQVTAFFLIIFGLSVYYLYFGQLTETSLVIILLVLSQLFLSLAKTLFIPAIVDQKMIYISIIEMACKVTGSLSAIILILQFNTTLYQAMIMIVATHFFLLFVSYKSAKSIRGRVGISFSVDNVLGILKTAWPFTLAMIVYFVYSRLAVIALTNLDSTESAGIFSSAMKFIEVGVMPLFFLGYAAYPLLSRKYSDNNQEFISISAKLINMCLFIGGGLFWMLNFVAPELITLFFGEKFTAARSILINISVISIFIALDAALLRIMLSMNMQVRRLIAQSIGVIALAISCALSIPAYGIQGAVFSVVFTQIVVVLISFSIIHSKIKDFVVLKLMYKYCFTFCVIILLAFLLKSIGAPILFTATSTAGLYIVLTVLFGLLPVKDTLKIFTKKAV